MDRIIKGIGGFYYVRTSEGIVECKARGIFRNKKLKPLVGDYVKISINENAENTIDEIFERKNSLIRPPVSNIDNLVIVSSMVTPAPLLYLIKPMLKTEAHFKKYMKTRASLLFVFLPKPEKVLIRLKLF